MVGKHHKLEDQLQKFTGQAGGHARDDRVDAMVWPIYLYMRKSKDALAEPDEDEANEPAESIR